MSSAFTMCAATRLLRVVLVALVIALAPVRAFAQKSDVDGSGNVVLGPLGVTPRISWHTEYNDNLYRSSLPVSDIISTIGAKTDVRTRMRRVGLTVSGGADWAHYTKLVNERGANAEGGLRFDFLFNRVVPYVSSSYVNSRHRLNSEIDTRPRVQHSKFTVGSVVRIGGKTAVDVAAGRGNVAYGRTAEADGVGLRETLNHDSQQVTLRLLQEITPLTSINVTSEVSRNDFSFGSRRNADTFRLTTGFESTGRLTGHARAGIQILKPQDASLPELRGLYVSVGTGANIRDRLQVTVDAQRDIAPSYRTVAYYAFYTYGTSITYAVLRSVRLSATVSRHVADYPDGATYEALSANQLGMEREMRYASGIGYHIGQSMAIVVSGAYAERTSILTPRRFDGLSLSAGVTHAF